MLDRDSREETREQKADWDRCFLIVGVLIAQKNLTHVKLIEARRHSLNTAA